MPEGLPSRCERRSRSTIAPARGVAAARALRGVAHVVKARRGFSEMSALRMSLVELANNVHPDLGNSPSVDEPVPETHDIDLGFVTEQSLGIGEIEKADVSIVHVL